MSFAGPVGQQGIVEELEDVSVLLFARGDCCPDTLTPAHARIAARALRDPAVNDAMTNRTLGAVVRRFDGRVRQEAKVGFGGWAFKSPGQREAGFRDQGLLPRLEIVSAARE